MKKLLIGALAMLGAQAAFAQLSPTYDSDEVYVKFNTVGNGRQPSEADRFAVYSRIGAQSETFLPQIGWYRVKLREGVAVPTAVDRLKAERRVRTAEPVYVRKTQYTPNDPLFNQQRWLIPINVVPAWDLFQGNDATVVAILDSGCDADHEDLSFVPGFNFSDNNTNADDVDGHGTGAAGMAAARADNSRGVASPGFRVKVMPVRVGDSLIFFSTEGILWAADNGAQIISMSYGGGFASQAEQDAVNYAYGRNVVLMASAGNSNLEDVEFYPAGLDNVVSVGASDDFDNRADFSNYGDWVDIAAPGVSTLTTAIGGGYGPFGGTSAACPAAAGVASLIIGYAPTGTSNTDIIDYLKRGADDIGDWVTEGRVNAARSLALVPRFSDVEYSIVDMGMVFGRLDFGSETELQDKDTAVAQFSSGNQQTMRSPAAFFYADFDVSADAPDIEELKVTLNAFASSRRVTQMIYAWDWNSNRWRFVRAAPSATGSGSTDQEFKVSNAQRFISDTGAVRIGVRALMPSASGAAGFRYTVDRLSLNARLLIR
jgi:thermitase